MEPSVPRTILYIEDDPGSRTLVERTLRFAGYQVVVAECGLDGIDMAYRENPDLILTDINLPDMSGREITTRLRSEARFATTPIVALTAQTASDQREMTFASGISGYLTKPVDVDALPGHIERFLLGAREHLEAGLMSQAQTRYMHEMVTRLEKQIRDLEQANTSLRRLDSMKDTFIQLTAHELRTPLTLVYGYSRLLEETPSVKALMVDDSNTHDLIRGLVDSTQRMQNIINEILTVSRIMTNQIDLSLGPTNLGATMHAVVEEYRRALTDRHITLEFDRSGFPDRIRADSELLQLAFNNLVSNAIKYTPDGGKVIISAHVEDPAVVCISVRDSGIGVAKEDHQHIFERFHTTGDTMLHSTSKTSFKGGGLGLGLAICKGIVEAHKGRIWVESPGRDLEKLPGSEFIISLPIPPVPQRVGGIQP